ncbi:mucin-2 [Episyrphus balteatus]|uniref:mucin-2 n=1 Tax=Episyrphus balteatus TaxID=286459 RepID=UPI0024855A04|nr:mucin-2 [Episyrphus balteatus]
MKTFKLLILVILQLASFCTSTSASTEPLASTSAVPFQLISPAQYQAILELNNGNPFISQNRLISGGSEVITDIINNIVNGLITPVNITGLDPINNSLLKPSIDKTQGYPFCTIQTNRNSHHSQRSYDAIVDPPGSNFGTFSINFYHPGTVNIDNYDEDLSTDELEPSDYRPSSTSRPAATANSNPAAVDLNKDKPNSSSGAPVINCIVVLKEPSPPATPSPTTPLPPTPTPTQRPPKRPSYYPHQYPTTLTHPPRDPHYSIGPYQIIPIPYPPFLGLLGPAASSSAPNWANWPNTPTFPPSNNPNSAISPTWPYWPSVNSPSVVAASQGMKGPGPSQTAQPTWPYLTTIPSQAASTQHHHHVPATLPFNIPSSFWTAINPNAAAENAVPLPSYPNPAAWYRPSAAGAFNPNQLMQQQQQQQYNEAANEIRSVLHDDETDPEDKENLGDALIEEGVQNSRKIQSRRMGEKRI